MEQVKVGWKTEEFEADNLVKFFIIAFGLTWLYWSLFILQIIKLPPGIGTPNVSLTEILVYIPIVVFSPYGPTFAAFLLTYINEGKNAAKTYSACTASSIQRGTRSTGRCSLHASSRCGSALRRRPAGFGSGRGRSPGSRPAVYHAAVGGQYPHESGRPLTRRGAVSRFSDDYTFAQFAPCPLLGG